MLILSLLSVNSCSAQAAADAKSKSRCNPIVTDHSESELIEPSRLIQVAAPTHFPKPSHWLGENATVLITPSFGRHRPAQDAIFAYAEGYQVEYYIMFLETLSKAGFMGDVVLAIAENRIAYPDVVDYLQTYVNAPPGKPNVVIYQVALDCDGDDGTKLRRVMPSGQTDVFQFCKFPKGVYGVPDPSGKKIVPAEDPREGRVVATLRYEWYWIWSLQYHAHSWLMLLDARDSFFQTNPFADLPRDTSEAKDGLLYLFGENSNATRLGKSTKNLKWLRNGYGDATLAALADKPTLCSGSTMGEQVATETYLRALVNEHDESDVRMTGSDQGFHNYLYYSRKLSNARTIRKIIVWEQGRGIINNLGALRTQTLEEWRMYCPDTHQVFNWDGTLSPVVHQWDRDKHLHTWMTRVQFKEWLQLWNEKKRALGITAKK